MKEYYHKFYSQYLNKDFELLVFGEEGIPFIIFPPAKGRFHDCKENEMIKVLEGFLDFKRIKVYCPDTIDNDSWHNFEIHPSERVAKHIKYEQAILHDVIDFAKHETEQSKVNLIGIGLGGYHALNTTLRHPKLFSNVILLDGTYDIKRFIFGHYDDDVYLNNPPDYLPNLEDKKYLPEIRKIKFHICAGEKNKFLSENKNMSKVFNVKHIPYEFNIIPGARHEWFYWNNIIPSLIAKIV